MVVPHINLAFLLLHCIKHFMYCIAQNFGGRKLQPIWWFTTNPPKFYPTIIITLN